MAGRDPEMNPAAFLGAELRRARLAAGFSSQDALAVKLGFERIHRLRAGMAADTQAKSRARPVRLQPPFRFPSA
jgi:hypothetical protein